MMKFLEEETLTPDEIIAGLRGAICQRRIAPVICGSALTGKGIRPLLNLIVQCLPDPTECDGIEMSEAGSDEKKIVKISPEGPTIVYIFKTIIDPYVGRMSFFKVIQGSIKSESSLLNINQKKTERIAHVLICKGKKTDNINELQAGDMGAIAKLEAAKTCDTLADPAAGDLMVTPLELPMPTAMMAVKAKSRTEEDKVGMGFHRLIDQDPTLSLRRDASIRQTILSGMGETQLQIAVARLTDLAKVEVDLEIPRVPYRETITKTGQGQGRYKKQSGGHGQYGDCWVRFEPLPEGSGFQFEWEIVGGVIPTNFKSAVEKGISESMERGILSGSQTVDVKAACYDGSYHAVDSSDMSFKVAASLAFKSVMPNCGPIVLEPIYKVKITVPEEYMGDVMGDLNSRRGRILGMNPLGKKQVIEALVPLSEMFVYNRQLNSLTQGRGLYEMEYDHYERVPNEVQEKIIEETKRRSEEDDA
jgi:elongation factor G